jgi:hypothetical protein
VSGARLGDERQEGQPVGPVEDGEPRQALDALDAVVGLQLLEQSPRRLPALGALDRDPLRKVSTTRSEWMMFAPAHRLEQVVRAHRLGSLRQPVAARHLSYRGACVWNASRSSGALVTISASSGLLMTR